MTEAEARVAVVAEARTWVGTPFHHMNRVKRAGVDCAHLVIGVMEAALSRFPHDPGRYPTDWMKHGGPSFAARFLAVLNHYGHEVQEPAQPGDLIVFRYGLYISHMAICVGGNRIVHAVRRVGVLEDDLDTNVGLAHRRSGVWCIWPESAANLPGEGE